MQMPKLKCVELLYYALYGFDIRARWVISARLSIGVWIQHSPLLGFSSLVSGSDLNSYYSRQYPTWYMDTCTQVAKTDTVKYVGVSLHLALILVPTRQCYSQEGQWNTNLPPAQPTQGANCSEDTNPSSARSLNTPVWYGTPTQPKT